jgi:hypothetical protein
VHGDLAELEGEGRLEAGRVGDGESRSVAVPLRSDTSTDPTRTAVWVIAEPRASISRLTIASMRPSPTTTAMIATAASAATAMRALRRQRTASVSAAPRSVRR